MKNKTFEDINDKYELEIEKIIRTIEKEKARRILVQFPDGMKPYANAIVDKINKETKDKNLQIFIWLDSCFGACDVPLEVSKLGVDLIVQFGHSAWNYHDKVDVIN